MPGEANIGSVASLVGAVRPPGPAAGRAGGAGGAGDFAASLTSEAEKLALKFSAHATQRLAARDIRFTPEDLDRVERAAGLAAQRGSRDALLMLGDLGLVVNINNRTVLTALDLRTMNDGIVTNIDSTVMVKQG
jgi:flagellar operon protein